MSGATRDHIDILHVDDDPQFRELTATYLEEKHDQFTVETASSAADGLNRLASAEYDCVISDYEMPGDDGIEFLESVREDNPEIPFILFTGAGSEEIASDAISAGVTDYLQKGPKSDQYTILANRIENSVQARRSAAELKSRRHQREQLLKTVPGCVVQLNEEGQFTYANRRAEEVLGLSESALTDRSYNDPEWQIRDLDGEPIPDEDLPFREVYDSGEPVYGRRHTVRWPDGTEKILLVNGAPVFDSNGTVDSVVFSLVDITEQHEYQRELTEAERRLRLALEATETGVWEWDMTTDEVTWDESLERLMGLEPGEFAGTIDAFTEYVHPEDVDRVQDEIEIAIENDELYQCEFLMFTADEEMQWVKVRGRPIEDSDDKRLVGSHTNITERKQRQAELDRQRSLLKAQQESVLDGIVVANEENEIISYNEQFVDLWGIPEELVTAGDEKAALDWAMQQVANPEAFREGVAELYDQPDRTARDELETADGRIFDRFTAPVVGDDGTYYGRLWAFRDITERKQREEKLQRQNTRLEEFTSVVSHDLRSPLATAAGYLELAAEDHPSEYIDGAADAVERSQELVEDLLTLAQDGEEIGEPSSIELESLAKQCWRTVPTESASLAVETAQTVAADQGRLRQLFENLFRNAVEHGGKDVRVTVGELPDGFYVEDDGPGIPVENSDRLFRAGYSGDDTGTGFGLRIVEQVTQAHDWEITATGGSEGGARFEITDVNS